MCRKILELLQKDIKPRDIMTKAAFQNALTIVMALGGSTNAVLHFLAIARSVNVELTLDDFQRISDQTPLIGDMKPSGRYVMEDLHKVLLRPVTHFTFIRIALLCLFFDKDFWAHMLAKVVLIPRGNDFVSRIT